MKPFILSAAVLAASLGVAAGTMPAPGSSPSAISTAAAANESASSSSLSSADRAELRAVEARDADLSQVKAGFELGDHDTALVLGTIAVVVLIALLL